MSRKKITITIDLPILPGHVSNAKGTCGQPNCACKGKPPKLHGPYHRWAGWIGGKKTTRVLSKEDAEECLLRIENYRRLQEQLAKILDEAIEAAPWNKEK